MLNKRDLAAGARKIVESCLSVQATEEFAVLVDRPNLEVGTALAAAGTDLGAEVSFLMMEQRAAHAVDPPDPLIQALLAADAAVLATVFSLSNSEARRRANREGTRVLSLPGCRRETLISGAIEADFEELEPLVVALGRELTKATRVEVKSDLGTDLAIELCGRKSVDQTAMARTRGSWAPAPNVETAVGPREDGVSGVLIVDGVLVPGGVPETSVRVTLERSRIESIEGGEEAEELERLLASFEDDAMYRLVEFGIGLNPKSRIGRGLMAEDESQFGTVHFGFGEGRTFGIDLAAPSHVDLVIRRPEVLIDGRRVLENETIREEFLKEVKEKK